MARLLILGPSGEFNAALAKLLERTGHEVEAQGTSPVDVWLVGGEPPDVVVIDAMRPHEDDRSYATALASEPALASVPCITLTTAPDRRPRIVADRARCPARSADALREVEMCLVVLARVASAA